MQIYIIKVALRGVSPMIWRRLRIGSHTSLAHFHHIIQVSMGWEDEYLHRFRIHGQDYGLSVAGGLIFNHDANLVFLDDFDFYAGERFTYTYNFIDHWLCDIRIECVEQSPKPTPWCYGGSGRQGEDHCRYYRSDELMATIDVLNHVITADESTQASELRPLIEHFEAVRFSRQAVTKQLKSLPV